MILEQIKKHLTSNTTKYIEIYFQAGDSVIARDIDYEQSTENFIKIIRPIPMIINLKNVLYVELQEDDIS